MIDAGLGNGGHHALLHALQAQLPDLGLDVGVAFGLLELVLDLLQRHLLPLEPLPVLEEVIGDRDRGQHRHHRAHQLQCQIGGDAEDRRGIEHQERFQAMALGPQHRHHDRAERDQLEHALGEIRHRLLAEDALQPGAGRYLAELRLQRFRRPHQPVLDHVAGDRGDHQHQQRHADRAEHGIAQRVAERQQRRAVGAKLAAHWRPGCAAASGCRRRSIPRRSTISAWRRAMMNQVLTSWLLATSPLACASSRRFCVGSSVLSSVSSAIGDQVSDLPERFRIMYFSGVSSCITPMK